MILNRDWKLASMQSTRDCELLSSVWYLCIIPLAPKVQGSSERSGWKDCTGQRQWISTVECSLDTRGKLHIRLRRCCVCMCSICVGQATQHSEWKRKLGCFIPSWGATGNRRLLGEGESVSFRYMATERLLCTSRWPYTHAHSSDMRWTLWVFKRKGIWNAENDLWKFQS